VGSYIRIARYLCGTWASCSYTVGRFLRCVSYVLYLSSIAVCWRQQSTAYRK